MALTKLLLNEKPDTGDIFSVFAMVDSMDKTGIVSLAKPYCLMGAFPVSELTIPQLDQITDGMAHWYQRKGVGPKDPVAIFLEDSIAYLLHYIALTKLGAIPVLLDSNLESSVAMQLIISVDAVAVVSEPNRLRDDWLYIQFFNPNQITLKTSDTLRRYKHHDDDPVLITHTSDSLGVPKAVQFNYKEFCSGIRQQMRHTNGLRTLLALPLSQASAIATLISALIRGGVTKLAAQKDPSSLLSVIEDFKPNAVISSQAIYKALSDADLERYDLDSISCWLSMDHINTESSVSKLIRYGYRSVNGVKKKGSQFIDAFSPVEFSSALFQIAHTLETRDYSRCIGRPFDCVDAQVFDDQANPVSAMTAGRLGVKAPTVSAGYWNNSLLTARSRIHGYWLTGDFVYQSQDGSYYHTDRT